jgi:hypothetical protein
LITGENERRKMMNDTVQKIILDPLKGFFENVLDFLPNLLTSLLILIIGIIIAMFLKSVLTRVFRTIMIDRLSDKTGCTEILNKGGIKEPASSLLSRIIGWLIVLTFLIISLNALNLPSIKRLLEALFLYLPTIFVAMPILFAGYILSNFLGRTVLIAAVNEGLKMSGIIAKFVKFTVFFLSIAMALEQLGIGKETVLIAFAIIYGGVVFALALAFGLGGRNTARDYIEKRLKGDEEKDDIQHL